MLALELSESLGAAMLHVDIEHDQAGLGAGADPDIRVRPSLPPSGDDGDVGAGALEAAFDPGHLAVERQHRPTGGGVAEGGGEHRARRRLGRLGRETRHQLDT